MAAEQNENKTPSADVFAGVDELFLLKRNRRIVRLLRDEEVLFDDDGFDRRVCQPGKKARRRIAFGLAEILEESEAESLLVYLDRRGWNFKFPLTLRDLHWTYQPGWFFRFFQFGIAWLIVLSPAAFVNPALVSLWGAAICGTTAAITLLVYLRIEESARAPGSPARRAVSASRAGFRQTAALPMDERQRYFTACRQTRKYPPLIKHFFFKLRKRIKKNSNFSNANILPRGF